MLRPEQIFLHQHLENMLHSPFLVFGWKITRTKKSCSVSFGFPMNICQKTVNVSYKHLVREIRNPLAYRVSQSR